MGIRLRSLSYGGQVATKTIDVIMPDNFVRGTLVNRYSFDGAADNTVVTDSVGGQHGELVSGGGTNFTGTGQVALPGGDGAGPLVAVWNGRMDAQRLNVGEPWQLQSERADDGCAVARRQWRRWGSEGGNTPGTG